VSAATDDDFKGANAEAAEEAAEEASARLSAAGGEGVRGLGGFRASIERPRLRRRPLPLVALRRKERLEQLK
jgi:hypothetical protein